MDCLPRIIAPLVLALALGTVAAFPPAAAESTPAMSQRTVALKEKILRTDSSAVAAPSGKLALAEYRRDAATAPRVAQAPRFPESETFALHSRPGSQRTIFLDFDGAEVSDTLWNEGEGSIPNGTYDGFSFDANFASFTTEEHGYIQEVWRIVAENYATFDVDVTTQDPGPDAYNRDTAADQSYGDHVLFSDDPDSAPLCGSGCSGAAFVDTFDELGDSGEYENFYEPTWVRKAGTPVNAAIAATHEIGHTLGLEHDGRTSPIEEAYSGHGAWAPIMGRGAKAINQFSKGEYPRSSNTQDDLAVIQAAGGLPELPDDAGNTSTTANTIGAPADVAIEGVITDRTDYDVYKVGPCVGAIDVSATGAGVGSALDLKIDVFTTTGKLLGTQNPMSGQAGNPPVPTGLDVPTFSVGTGGTYLVKVDGIGAGSTGSTGSAGSTGSTGSAGTTGYTDYGSIGTYTLTIAGCSASNGTPPGPVRNIALTHNQGSGTVTWNPPLSTGSTPVTGYRITGLPEGPYEVPAGTFSRAVTVKGGVDVTVSVAAINASGVGTPGSVTQHIDSWAPAVPPNVTVRVNALMANIAWRPGANPGGSVLTGWQVREGNTVSELPVPDYQFGVNLSYESYGSRTVTITPLMFAEDGSTSPSRTVTFVLGNRPGAPRIGTAVSGRKGKPVTATARWVAGTDGGAAITSYKVVAYRLSSKGKVLSTKVSPPINAKARSYAFRLRAGKYRFKVVAYNVKGGSPASTASRVVTAR